MKNLFKLFLALICCFGISFAVMAEDFYSQEYIQKVTSLGQNLLQKSSIPVRVSFNVLQSEDINAFATTDKEVYVYTGLLKYVTNDEELAATIAHELGHIINSHTTKKGVMSMAAETAKANVKMNQWTQFGVESGQQVVMTKLSRTDEYEADITGVDLLYNAGYNPLAMVSLLYKISDNYVDILSTHPSGDKRTKYVYDYIRYAYPDALEKGFDTVSFQNFKVYAEQNSTPEEIAEFNAKQEELKQKRLEKLEKYKNAKQNSGWDNTYHVMRGAGAIYNGIMNK